MKSLTEYINEELEFEKTDSGYYNVVLCRRENIDLSTISEEDFIKYMMEDLEKAGKEYVDAVTPVRAKEHEEYIEREIRKATKFAEKKWKTDKKRNEYIENIRKNVEASPYWNNRKEPKPSDIWFDFKPDLGRMGIPSYCLLTPGKVTEKQLSQVYNEYKDNKFFKMGKGWAFKYETSSEKYLNVSFRPWVDILMSDDDKAEQKREGEELAAAVRNFYKDTDYWGD